MASTWSNAELRLMTTGENDNTWGDQTNDNLKRLDDMVNAYIGVTLSGATKTLILQMIQLLTLKKMGVVRF